MVYVELCHTKIQLYSIKVTLRAWTCKSTENQKRCCSSGRLFRFTKLTSVLIFSPSTRHRGWFQVLIPSVEREGNSWTCIRSLLWFRGLLLVTVSSPASPPLLCTWHLNVRYMLWNIFSFSFYLIFKWFPAKNSKWYPQVLIPDGHKTKAMKNFYT